MKPQLLGLSKGVSFVARQQHDWKVTVARTSLDRLAYQIVFPYLSIYIVALGASATQLGLVNSAGMVIAAFFGPFIGLFIDRKGPKKMYLLGIGLLIVSYLSYSLAQSWPVAILAMASYWLGFSASIHSCATICGRCLANRDRATGMTVCETVAAGLMGMAGPMLAAWLVMRFGGVDAGGIRPLFFVALAITIGTFALVLTQLPDRKLKVTGLAKPNMLLDLHQVLKEGRNLKKWVLLASVGQLPLAMVFPYSQVFAHEVKGASELLLGTMVTASALTSIVFALPMGRLADRVGRKNVLYAMIPLFWMSNLVLVWSPTPSFLILAGILQGFYFVGGPISAAMERELVPAEQMGRWIGINRFFRMLLSACMAFVGGIIWDRVGPQYVFLTFICLDVVLRMPLLISMPETLGLRFGDRRLATSKGSG